MICRQCGTEIADKALICYRCGAATTERRFEPPAPKRRIPWAMIVALVILLFALVVALVLYMQRRDAVPRGGLIRPSLHYVITPLPHDPMTPLRDCRLAPLPHHAITQFPHYPITQFSHYPIAVSPHV
jgi:hypothetical protein